MAVDKIIIDNKEIELNDDLFLLDPADAAQHEIITRPSLTFWQDARIRLFKNKGALVGLSIVCLLVVFTIFAPMFSPYKYDQQNLYHAKMPPKMTLLTPLGIFDGKNSDGVDVYKEKGVDTAYWFGTDELGRDLWTRVWTGARISLYIAVLAAVCDVLVGVTYGGISAYYGGKVDIIMQRIVEVLVGIPSLVVVTLFIMVFKPGILSLSLAMVVTGWIGMSRVVRGQILKLKNQEFVLASRTLGASDSQLIRKHLVPNVVAPVVVMMMFTLPTAIFYEAFLSFIGLGLQPPYASLGSLISDGFKTLQTNPYMMFIPSSIVCLLMLSFNLVADGLRDAVDPKMRNQ